MMNINIKNTYQSLCEQMEALQSALCHLEPSGDALLLQTEDLKRKLIDFYNTLHLYQAYAKENALQKAQLLIAQTPSSDDDASGDDAKSATHTSVIENDLLHAVNEQNADLSIVSQAHKEEVDKPLKEESPVSKNTMSLELDTKDSAGLQTDLFSKVQDLNEQFAQQNTHLSVADSLHKEVACKFQQLIDINDKFFFVNELFKGDVEAYQKAISDIDSCVDRAQVQKMLISLRQRQDWDMESEAYERWSGLISKMWQ